MKIRLFLKKTLPHNFLWGSITKKRCFFTVSTVVVFLIIFIYSCYGRLTGSIDAAKEKTDALEERLEQQLFSFDGVDAAEVTISADDSVMIQLKVQSGFAFEDQIKEYVQGFVSCMPEDISLIMEKD